MDSTIMEKVVALCKRRGFIYPGSELYGGLANTYDYGPMGTELLRNIKNLWWKYFVQKRSDMVGLDASLISHHGVWEASGHTAGFADALIDCKNCKHRMRADHLIEESLKEHENVEGLTTIQLDEIISDQHIPCPNCGKFDWTKVRKFNQLFPVQLGIVDGEQGLAYLRGETAQGMFINFQNVLNSTRMRLPFGIAQLGKSFRNEITPGNSVFRTLEFEQGEIEYFFDPEMNSWEDLFEDWKQAMWKFVTEKLAIKEKNLRWRIHTDQERSFYSMRTEDLEYQFPFGFKELWGLAYRTDYDLSAHMKFSKKDLYVTDPYSGKKILPHVIEPAVGINRIFLMILIDAYHEEEKRTVLKIHPKISPVKIAVFPLLSNKEELVKTAKKIYEELKDTTSGLVQFDDRGNIGKRYLAQDEIGTPFCVTIDFQTIEDNTVTVRDRNTTEQERIPIESFPQHLQSKLV